MATWRIQEAARAPALRRWQDGLARAFVRLDARAVGPQDVFEGRIEQARAGALRISRVAASGHEVVRRAEHAARGRGDTVFANLQLSGRGAVTMAGGRVETGPMDLCLVPTGEPYAIRHDRAFELVSFALPGDALPHGLGPGRLALSGTPAGRELAGVLGSLAALAVRMPAQGAVLAGQIAATLGLAAAAVADAPEDDEALRAAIAAHLGRRHADPGLSARHVAAAFGLSERRLHALFAPTGESVGARIEAARLATAARLLETTGDPVSVVAARSGYRDPAYLARQFRRARGCSPRDWRAARSSR